MTAKWLRDSDCRESDCIKPSSNHRQSWLWSDDFPFVVYTEGKAWLCQKCRGKVRNRNGTWTTLPWLTVQALASCSSLRRDSILEHVRSNSHGDAVKAEREALQARLRGGIRFVPFKGKPWSVGSSSAFTASPRELPWKCYFCSEEQLSTYRCGCKLFLAISDRVHNTFPFLQC